MTGPGRGRRYLAIVATLAIVYTVCMSALSIRQHHAFRTQMNDLGNHVQAIESAAHGNLAMAQSNTLDPAIDTRLGVHANLVYWLIAPLYRVIPMPELLLILASIGLGAAGLGLFAYARHRLGETAWCLVPPIAFWASPIVHDSNLYDFQVLALASAFTIWMVWAFETGHRRTAWTLLALACACKENMPLVTLFYGVALMLDPARRRTGARIALVSAVYFAAVVWVMIPLINGGHGLEKLHGSGSRYGWITPGLLVEQLVRPDRLRVPVYLCISGAIVALGQWRLLLPVIPEVGASVLSDMPFTTRVTGTYYWLICISFIMMACVAAAAPTVRAQPPRRPWPLVYLGGVTVVLSLLLSPLPHAVGSSWRNYDLPSDRGAFDRVAARIPDSAAVCAQNNLGPHLEPSRAIYVFPACRDAEYVLVWPRYIGGPDAGLSVRTTRIPMGYGLVSAGWLRDGWSLVTEDRGCYLFRRAPAGTSDTGPAIDALKRDVWRSERDHASARVGGFGWTRWLNEPLSWSGR